VVGLGYISIGSFFVPLRSKRPSRINAALWSYDFGLHEQLTVSSIHQWASLILPQVTA
jgi:hypothetical protein